MPGGYTQSEASSTIGHTARGVEHNHWKTLQGNSISFSPAIANVPTPSTSLLNDTRASMSDKHCLLTYQVAGYSIPALALGRAKLAAHGGAYNLD